MPDETYKKVSTRIESDWYPYHEEEWFTHNDICIYFQWDEPQIRKSVSFKLYHDFKLLAEPRLEKNNKAYRIIDRTLEEIDWDNADPGDIYQLKFPHDASNSKGFPFEEFINLPPGGLVIIAGASNAGKTTWLLNMLVRNMDEHNSYYFTNELSAVAIKRRMMPFDGFYELRNGDNKPKFKVFDRTDNFHDAIRPDGLNYIDYLDVNNEAEYYKMKPYLKRIKRALNRGVAIVALQKRPGAKDAYGGANMRGDADLYISLDFGKLEIIKAKDWQVTNPNGLKYKFEITDSGSNFTKIEEIFEDNVGDY